MAVAPGVGIYSKVLWTKETKTELSLKLPPEVIVRGRLLTPGGQPAAGVRVVLDGFHNDAKGDEGMGIGLNARQRGPSLLAKAAKDRQRRPFRLRERTPGNVRQLLVPSSGLRR